MHAHPGHMLVWQRKPLCGAPASAWQMGIAMQFSRVCHEVHCMGAEDDGVL